MVAPRETPMSEARSRIERTTFPLTDEQRLVADTARDFAARRLAPRCGKRLPRSR